MVRETAPVTRDKINVCSPIALALSTLLLEAVNSGATFRIKSDDSAIPWPASEIATAAPIGESPAWIATGINSAPISGTAGAGQKNNDKKYVTTTSTQKIMFRFHYFWKGRTICSSAPIDLIDLSSAVIIAMIKKMLNSSAAAVKFALKIAWIPSMKDPVKDQATKKTHD